MVMSGLLVLLLAAVPAFAQEPPELSAHQKSLLPEGVAEHLSLLNDDTLRAIALNLPIEEGAEVGAEAHSWRRLALPSIKRNLDNYRLWKKGAGHTPQGENITEMRGFLKADLLGGLGESPPQETAEKKVDERPVQAPVVLEDRPVPPVEAVPDPPKPKPKWRQMIDDLMQYIPD